jgi:hypothetical protein
MAGISAARADAMVGTAARDVWIVIVFSLSVKEMPAGDVARAQPSGTFTSYWPEPPR